MGLLGLITRAKLQRKIPPTPILRELRATPDPLTQPAREPEEPPAKKVRRSVFEAIARGDEGELARLCREHRDVVMEQAPLWLLTPEGLATNRRVSEWFAEGVDHLTRLTDPRAE